MDVNWVTYKWLRATKSDHAFKAFSEQQPVKYNLVEPKPECDHIVALREVMSVICLPLSKLKELSDLHKRDGTWEEIFYWLGEEECTSRECPLCYEKLDWEAIEKQINQKKDD